jgi:hypothetical protein
VRSLRRLRQAAGAEVSPGESVVCPGCGHAKSTHDEKGCTACSCTRSGGN